MGNTFGTEFLLHTKRLHHSSFVHWRKRPRRTIGFEKCDLLLQTGYGFRYHRHFRNTTALPLFKTLESVDNLVISVHRLCDAKRQITQLYRTFRS